VRYTCRLNVTVCVCEEGERLTSVDVIVRVCVCVCHKFNVMVCPGNTKGGSITVPLTSCLTG
jgi:hypothetical protein